MDRWESAGAIANMAWEFICKVNLIGFGEACRPLVLRWYGRRRFSRYGLRLRSGPFGCAQGRVEGILSGAYETQG